jgi:hypothetical protein
MGHEAYEAEIETGGAGCQAGRLIATLFGVGALVGAAFLKWTSSVTGDKLTLRALVSTDLGTQSDFMRTVGALSILIGLVAVIGMVDRTGWLTRLAGAAALVVSVMFAIATFRANGNSLGTALHHDSHLGSGLELVGALVLLIGGFLGSRVVHVAKVAEPEPIEKLLEEPVSHSNERGSV